jgi:hypothetical protein
MRLVLRDPSSSPPSWLHSGGMAGPFFEAVERAKLSDLLGELATQATA